MKNKTTFSHTFVADFPAAAQFARAFLAFFPSSNFTTGCILGDFGVMLLQRATLLLQDPQATLVSHSGTVNLLRSSSILFHVSKKKLCGLLGNLSWS